METPIAQDEHSSKNFTSAIIPLSCNTWWTSDQWRLHSHSICTEVHLSIL